MLLLAIDVGTSSAKAILYDAERSALVASAGCEYPILQPAPGAAEQDPDVWWQAVDQAVRAVCAEGRAKQVRAVGLTGQMHGTVLLNAAYRPVRRAIIWADQRSAASCSRIIDQIGAERYTEIAGTLPAPGFMASTLAWLLEEDPASLDVARVALLPKDYIRLLLTGEMATDASDAASTALFDVSRGEWSNAILQALALPLALFPRVCASADQAGVLRDDVADAWGLPRGIPVAVGCADQPAQALANNLVDPGAASVTIGTGGQVFLPLALPTSGKLRSDYRLHIFNHAVPDRLYVLGAILSAGLSLRWLRNLLGLIDEADAYALLSEEAASVPEGAGGLIFLPYLVGERTPHMDAAARGAFIGLTLAHSRGHLARAVMEGVTFALRQALELSQALAGNPQQIVLSGGGAESALWRQIQADIYGLPLRKSLLTEQTCVGAALLGGVAAGIYSSLEEACQTAARFGPWIEPDPVRRARYQEQYEQFLALYPRLRDDFHSLASRT